MAKAYKHLIWDLDGTITNSYKGIAEALDILFERKQINVDSATYSEYIGPPLRTSFAQHFSVGAEMDDALRIFREYYNTVGIYHAELFPKIDMVLGELKNRGYQLFIATTKRETFAIEVVKSFGIFHHFERVFGADDAIGIVEKEDVLANLFANYPTISPSECIMIGDTIYDMNGAQVVGIDYLAALYGFGRNEDILKGAALSVSAVDEYLKIFSPVK